MSYRFASPELLRLGPPPSLASKDFESLNAESIADLLSRFNAAGISYDVQNLETDPAIILTQSAAYRDMLRRRQIDDAVAQTYLGSATGEHLDRRAADYGVLRRAGEDDESLRLRAQLAWEALSVAGPAGAYVFHALEAHPQIAGAAVYGPETGIVDPGEVLVVLQGRSTSGVPSIGHVDSVAARLDAAEVRYATGAVVTRPVRDEQSIRPLGARVIVEAVKPVAFYVSAKLYVRPGPDPEVIRQRAVERLNAYLAQRRTIATEVPLSGIIAALHVADANGLPVVDEVELLHPLQDVTPAHNEIATVSVISVTYEVR